MSICQTCGPAGSSQGHTHVTSCDNNGRWIADSHNGTDPDDDYLGIEVIASNERFAGSAYIYAGVAELSLLAAKLDGFPRSDDDRRSHEFGNRNPACAGGFVGVTLHCLDRAGHLGVDLVFEDDNRRDARAHAAFGFRTEPAALDKFIESLRQIERNRFGSASLALT